MELLKQPGGHVYVAHCPIWDAESSTLGGRDHLLVGVMPETLKTLGRRGLSVRLGQLYGVVSPGLIFCTHLFEGLKRGMLVGDDGRAEKQKLAATWQQDRDAKLVRGRHDHELEFSAAPASRVFVVYISRNRMLSDFPQVYGWAEHWGWLAADPKMPGAPVEWQTRYDKCLWSVTVKGV